VVSGKNGAASYTTAPFYHFFREFMVVNHLNFCCHAELIEALRRWVASLPHIFDQFRVTAPFNEGEGRSNANIAKNMLK
jgi:hypothetical protein